MTYSSRILVGLVALAVAGITSPGQIPGGNSPNTLGEELRPLERSKQGDDVVLGDIQKYFVNPQKTKAIVKAVDLEARTISVVPAKKNGFFRVAEITKEGRSWSNSKEMTLVFVTPKGLEQIKASGQAAKSFRKKRLLLEEIPLDATIKLEYYPGGPAAREVMVINVPES